MHKVILARSFSDYEQKRMGWRALLCCFIMAFTFCTVFKPYIALLPNMDLDISMASGLKILMGTQELSQPPQSYTNVESATPKIQNLTNSRSQVYEINGDIRVHGNSSTIFIATNQQLNTTSWTTKPYARIFDKTAMGKVRNLKITNQNPNTIPPCSRSFDSPAVVLSVGGYTGNPFHDFTDVLIPLYLTSQQFNTTVIFLVANMNSRWTSKYKLILNSLSKYDVIDIDNNQDEVLCFPRIIVGLKSHKEFGIDQSKSPNYSMIDFTKFLRNTYSLERGFIKGCKNKSRRPRLLVISRKKTRHLRNEDDVATLARSVGFDVRVREMRGQVALVAKIVNSYDVVVAVHGAGITNMVFLPQNAVVIEIVPFGLEKLSRNYFEIPSKDMNLKYLEYKVSVEESSLVEKYGVEDEVFRNPSGLHKKGWHEFRSIYLDNQDVNVDLFRFRRTLLEAMELVCS